MSRLPDDGVVVYLVDINAMNMLLDPRVQIFDQSFINLNATKCSNTLRLLCKFCIKKRVELAFIVFKIPLI